MLGVLEALAGESVPLLSAGAPRERGPRCRLVGAPLGAPRSLLAAESSSAEVVTPALREREAAEPLPRAGALGPSAAAVRVWRRMRLEAAQSAPRDPRGGACTASHPAFCGNREAVDRHTG